MGPGRGGPSTIRHLAQHQHHQCTCQPSCAPLTTTTTSATILVAGSRPSPAPPQAPLSPPPNNLRPAPIGDAAPGPASPPGRPSRGRSRRESKVGMPAAAAAAAAASRCLGGGPGSEIKPRSSYHDSRMIGGGTCRVVLGTPRSLPTTLCSYKC